VSVFTTAWELLLRLGRAAPVAWRQDRLFRITAIGAGVTGVLLLLRVVGPHDPALQASDPGPTGVPTLPAVAPPGHPALPPINVPKIAPGHPLDDVVIVPAPDGDPFGTAPPTSHR
jgi:hypothetical protein